MQPFNLTRLNMFSPYPVWQNSSDSYKFRTDFGVVFRVVFTRNQDNLAGSGGDLYLVLKKKRIYKTKKNKIK